MAPTAPQLNSRILIRYVDVFTRRHRIGQEFIVAASESLDSVGRFTMLVFDLGLLGYAPGQPPAAAAAALLKTLTAAARGLVGVSASDHAHALIAAAGVHYDLSAPAARRQLIRMGRSNGVFSPALIAAFEAAAV